MRQCGLVTSLSFHGTFGGGDSSQGGQSRHAPVNRDSNLPTVLPGGFPSIKAHTPQECRQCSDPKTPCNVLRDPGAHCLSRGLTAFIGKDESFRFLV